MGLRKVIPREESESESESEEEEEALVQKKTMLVKSRPLWAAAWASSRGCSRKMRHDEPEPKTERMVLVMRRGGGWEKSPA